MIWEMSKQIAVDIVLIPPKEILELAIRINRTFKDMYPTRNPINGSDG